MGDDPEGATELDPEQRAGLRLSWVTTHADLNQAEAENILKASLLWRRRARATGKRRLIPSELLDHVSARALHEQMYNDVWDWAGTYRQRETNIGVAPWRISTELANLLADAQFWVEGDDPMPLDAAACQLHHRLVAIHPFPNGNGRHAREMADLLLICRGAPPFTWGQSDEVTTGTTRSRYIAALRAADARDYRPLEAFVRN